MPSWFPDMTVLEVGGISRGEMSGCTYLIRKMKLHSIKGLCAVLPWMTRESCSVAFQPVRIHAIIPDRHMIIDLPVYIFYQNMRYKDKCGPSSAVLSLQRRNARQRLLQ